MANASIIKFSIDLDQTMRTTFFVHTEISHFVIHPSFLPEELCHPSPCGQNMKCSVQNGVINCSCLPGFTGSPLGGCRHECESDGECGGQEFCKEFKCESSCSQCGQGATCVRTTNHRAVCECPKV